MYKIILIILAALLATSLAWADETSVTASNGTKYVLKEEPVSKPIELTPGQSVSVKAERCNKEVSFLFEKETCHSAEVVTASATGLVLTPSVATYKKVQRVEMIFMLIALMLLTPVIYSFWPINGPISVPHS